MIAKLSHGNIPRIKVVLDYGCPKEKDGLPKKYGPRKKEMMSRKKG